MGLLRLAWRLPPLLLFMVGGTLLIFATPRHGCVRERVVTGFCRGLLRALGVRVTVRGQPVEGTALVVANHVSWLDVILLRAQLPAAFVAKSEVARWPVIGALAARAGNIFVERANIFACYHSLPRIQAVLRERPVAVFPEATTTRGVDCAPYRGMFLETAVREDVPVQPVALRYLNPQGLPCTAAPFVGDDTLVGSLLVILTAPAIRARIVWLAPVPALDRHSVAERCRRRTQAELQDPNRPVLADGDEGALHA